MKCWITLLLSFALVLPCLAPTRPVRGNSQSAKPIASGGAYTPGTAYFAGDGQCWLQGPQIFAADDNTFYYSNWIKPDAAGVNTAASLFALSSDGARIVLTSGNQINIRCNDATDTELINVNTVGTIVRDGNTWTHIFIRLDRTVDDQIEIYINGVDDTDTPVAFLSTAEDADPIDLDNGASAIASEFGGSDFEGCYADNYISSGNTYASMTISDFYNAGNPVNLGGTGTGPDGTQPEVLLAGNGTGFTANSGSAGNFTKQGTTALTTCSDTP